MESISITEEVYASDWAFPFACLCGHLKGFAYLVQDNRGCVTVGGVRWPNNDIVILVALDMLDAALPQIPTGVVGYSMALSVVRRGVLCQRRPALPTGLTVAICCRGELG